MRLAVEITEAENLFETLASKSPVGICIVQDGKFCYTNPTFQHNTGYREDELLGRDSLELVVPEDRGIARENAIKMLKGESTLPHQFRVIHNDGSIHWVIESVASVQYRGRPAILGNFVDITEHKQIQEQHKLFAEHSMDIIYCLRLKDEHYIYLSPAVERMLGYTAQEALALQTKDVLTQESYEKQKSEMLKDLENGVLQRTLQLEAVHKDGHIVPIEVHASFISDETGQPVEIVGIVRDITERKQQELAYKTIIQTTVDGFLLMDMQGRFLEVNDAYSRLIGYGRDELLMMNISDIEVIEKPGEMAARIARIREVGGDHFETHHKRKDGRIVDVEVSVNYLKVSGGRLVSFIRDITTHKQAEGALQAEKNKLQSLIDAMDYTLTIQDTEYNIIYQNEQSRIASGGDHLGEKCYRVYEGRETVCEGCPVEKAFKDGKSHTAEKMTTIGGKVTFWENTANPIRDAEGKIVSCLELTRDVTERKRAEEALQAEKNKLQSLIDAMENGFTIQDRDYNIIYQNEPLKEIFGDQLGEKCYRVYESKEKICEGCPVEKAFRDGKSHTAERKVTLPSGKVTFWENTANPIRDAKGEMVSCLEVTRDITERKRAEETLRESHEELQKMFESVTDGILVIDLNGIITEVNQRTVEMHGFSSKGELIGKSALELIAPQDREKVAKNMKKALKQGTMTGVEYTMLWADGTQYPGELSTSVLRDAEGKWVGHITVARDITERKRAEEALRQSEENYRALFESAVIGTVVIDAKTMKVMMANQAAAEMLGFSSGEEVIGVNPLDFVPPEDRESVSELLAKEFFEQDLRRTHELRMITKDGRKIWISANGARIIHEGSLVGLASFTDITERKKMEEAIKQAAEEWRKTFDSISDAISIHDRDHKILRANKAFADIFHKKPSQILGRYCYELHKGNKPISGCPHKQTLATKEPAAAEFYESHLGKYLHESTSPIFDENGEVVGTVHISRDVTEQKQQNERLMMTDRLASIGELAAGTAHELNNPLTSVIGFSQLLMERDIPDDIREDLNLIYNEAQRAAGVTKNLLAFARKHAPVKQLNQINNTIEDVLELRAYEHKVNSIEVQRQLAPDLPEIEVDYFQMQQVFLNIIINAEYFMTEAHNRGTLTITTKKQNSTARISIADDGPGISKENLSRIFDPFFTTKEAGKGTGLGLSICHGIVAKHGGQMYARSQPGKGATIVVELPINSH